MLKKSITFVKNFSMYSLNKEPQEVSLKFNAPAKGTMSPRYTGTIPDAFKRQEEMAWNEYQRSYDNTDEYFFGRLSKNYKNQRNLAYANYQNVINQILANDAGTMMSVYRQAGLNPNLAISGGLSGSAAGMDAYQLPEADGSGFMNVASGVAGLMTSGIGAVATRAGLELTKEQISGQKLANQFAGLSEAFTTIDRLVDQKVFSSDEGRVFKRKIAEANYQTTLNTAETTGYQAEQERIKIDEHKQNVARGELELELAAKNNKLKDVELDSAKSALRLLENQVKNIPVQNAFLAAQALNEKFKMNIATVQHDTLQINYERLVKHFEYEKDTIYNNRERNQSNYWLSQKAEAAGYESDILQQQLNKQFNEDMGNTDRFTRLFLGAIGVITPFVTPFLKKAPVVNKSIVNGLNNK